LQYGVSKGVCFRQGRFLAPQNNTILSSENYFFIVFVSQISPQNINNQLVIENVLKHKEGMQQTCTQENI